MNSFNNEIDNSILFFKIWRNLYLKKIIIFELKLLNIHYFKRKYNYIKYINDGGYSYKEYLRSIELILTGVDEPWRLDKLDLPSNIEELDMGVGFSIPQGEQLRIPNSLKIKTFKFPYRTQMQPTPEFITPHLKTLVLSQSFNQPLYQLFNTTNSASLVSLNLGCDFNHPIQEGVLPPNLKYLKLSDRFNHRLVAGVLPNKLQSIHFGCDFNQPLLPLDLPQSIVTIHFGNCFDRPLKAIHHQSKKLVSILPNCLEYVRFGSQFSQDIEEGALPDTLQSLVLTAIHLNTSKKRKIHIVPNLTTLVSTSIYKVKYPKSTQSLSLSKIVISIVDKNFDLDKMLPSSLTSLKLDVSNFIVKKNTLPISLKKLTVTSSNVIFEPNSIPPNVTEIRGCHPNVISTIAPLSVKSYTLSSLPHGSSVDITTYQSLPQNISEFRIKCISLFGNFSSMNHIVTLILDYGKYTPLNVTSITNLALPPLLVNLVWAFTSVPLNSVILPNTLQLLELGSFFNQTISNEWLPASLTHLILKGKGKIESLPSGIQAIYIYSGNNEVLDSLKLTPEIINILYVLRSDYNMKLQNIFKKLLNRNNNNKIETINNNITNK